MSADGLDLARTALAAARATARTKGAAPAKRKPKRTGAAGVRASGRDPVTLADALAAVGRDRGWENGTRAGTVLDRWAQLVPEQIVRAATPEHFDQEHGILHLRPVSQAAASMLRWNAATLAAQINNALGTQAVAGVKVLAVRAAPMPRSAPQRDCPAITPERKVPGYVPGLRVGCGAPMPPDLQRWRDQRKAEREQRPIDEARAQAGSVRDAHPPHDPGPGTPSA